MFPSLTVRENLQVGAFSGRKGEWNVESVVELFPLLKPLLKRQAASLSGGEQQALAIGRALMANPRLLLLDEVSLGLAPVVIKAIYEAMVTSAGPRYDGAGRRAGRPARPHGGGPRRLLPRGAHLAGGRAERAEPGRDHTSLLRDVTAWIG